METGRSKDNRALYAALDLADRPFGTNVEMDYALAFTREILIATPLGSRFGTRLVNGAVPANVSGIVVSTVRPTGVWIEEVCPDQNANVALNIITNSQLSNLANFQGRTTSFDQPSLPQAFPGGFAASDLSRFIQVATGDVLLASFSANYAFVPAQQTLTSRIGGRLWLPPGWVLELAGTAANATFSCNVNISWQAAEGDA